ncbi:MAG: maleylpyruvate isomerase family mycothiol-dependent enzyme [Actinomycetota bacterium]
MAIDDKAKLIAERVSLLETVEQLEPEEWDTPSLAVGWRVRDVVAHVNFNKTLGLGTSIVGMIRARGDFDRFMATHARKIGDRPIAEHLADLRRVARSDAIAPTTKPSDGAIDAFVHHHDIALAVGRSVPTDEGRLRWLADGVPQATRFIGCAARVDGVRMIATDIDWHYGTGPEVRGPAAAIILAACGRSVWHDRLEGPGLDVMTQRR